jgi:hypothetical protein
MGAAYRPPVLDGEDARAVQSPRGGVRDTVLNVKLPKGVVVRNWDQMPALI